MQRTIEIEVEGHEGIGGVYRLTADRPIEVGRAGGCTITLDDPLIAPKHCRIVLERGEVVLKNLDQEIGVFCDGSFVEQRVTLAGEHEIELSEARIRVRVVAEAEPRTAPVAETPVVVETAVEMEAPPVVTPSAGLPGPAVDPVVEEPVEPEPAPERAPDPEPAITPGSETVHEPPAHTEEAPVRHPDPFAEREPVAAPEIEPEPVREPDPVPDPAPISEPEPVATPEPEPVFEPEPEPEPRPEPEPEPIQEPEPVRTFGLDDLDGATAAFVEPLAEEFGLEEMTPGQPALLEKFVARVRELSGRYGLAGDDDRRALLRCMLLIGDDLSVSSRRNADIEATLSLADRPAEQRLRRATKIAELIANEHGGAIGLAPPADPGRRGGGVQHAFTPGAMPAAVRSPEAASEPAPQANAEPVDAELSALVEPAGEPIAESVQRPAPAPAISEVREPERPVPPAPELKTEPMIASPAPAPDPGPAPATARDDSLPSIAGYTVESAAGRELFAGSDAATFERVLIGLAAGGASAAQERLTSASGLMHRNLAKVLDSGVTAIGGVERAYVVIEDEGSATLGDVIERVSLKPFLPLSGDELWRSLGLAEGMLAPQIAAIAGEGERIFERLVLNWIADLAEAMQLAHEAGLVHAGLHPGSVAIDRHGMVVLRWLGRHDGAETTIDRIDAESLDALSPERVASLADGTPLPLGARAASDVWSLGVLGVSLLTGRSPFGGSRGETLAAIVTREIGDAIEGVSDESARALLSALERDPARRPPAASAYAQRLRTAAQESGDEGGKKRFALFGRKG